MTRPATALTRFSNRYRHGQEAEFRLDRVLERLGVRVFPFGLSVLEPSLIEQLRSLKDSASLFIRFLPDRIGFLKDRAFLVEYKSAMIASPYFALNLQRYQFQLKLSRTFKLPLLVVFYEVPIRSQWITRLKLERTVTSSNSDRSFILIRKDSLPRLETFFKGVLHEQND